MNKNNKASIIKINYKFLLLIIFALHFSLTAISQTNNNNLNSYQKNIKFNSSITIDEAKENFMKEFGLDDNTTFVEYQYNIDKKGGVHQKFQQYYKEIKVEYGTMIVHSKDGNITSINGELYNPDGLNLASNISSITATQKAISYVGAEKYLWSDTESSKISNYKKTGR